MAENDTPKSATKLISRQKRVCWGWKWYIQKRVNRDKIDFATKARMLGLPASVKAPALAATGGRAVAQLIAPWDRSILTTWKLIYLVQKTHRDKVCLICYVTMTIALHKTNNQCTCRNAILQKDFPKAFMATFCGIKEYLSQKSW